MDPVLLARFQFAITIGFHFIFPPVTIGLAWLLVYFFHKYKTTGDAFYGSLAKFWLKIFAMTFVVGDIFGAPLAAEVGRQPWIVWKELRTADAASVTV